MMKLATKAGTDENLFRLVPMLGHRDQVLPLECPGMVPKFQLGLTAVKREKFAKNKKNTSKERLSLLLFKV